METSILLAQFLGIYLIVKGLFVAVRQKDAARLVSAFQSNLALRYIAGILAFLFGLYLVLVHNVWTGTWEVVVTILAWGIMLKGILALLAPESFFQMAKTFGVSKNYPLAAAIVIVLGGYLVYVGFFAV